MLAAGGERAAVRHLDLHLRLHAGMQYRVHFTAGAAARRSLGSS